MACADTTNVTFKAKIVQSLCIIDPKSENQSVSFGEFQSSDIDSFALGTVIKTMPLNFYFNCPQGITRLHMSANSTAADPKDAEYLLNTNVDGAKSLAVSVTDLGNNSIFFDGSDVKTYRGDPPPGETSIKLKAYLVRWGEALSTGADGTFSTNTDFTFTYD